MNPVLFFERVNLGLLIRLAFLRLFLGDRALRESRRLIGIYRVSQPARGAALLFRFHPFRWRVEELDFDFFDDVRIPGGPPAMEEFYFDAPSRLLQRVERHPDYEAVIRRFSRIPSHERYLRAFVSKKLYLEFTSEVRNVLVAAWASRGYASPGVLYRKQDWMFPIILEYALERGVQLRPISAERIPWSRWSRWLRRWLRRAFFTMRELLIPGNPPDTSRVRVAVEMYQGGIRLEGITNSEFFWYRRGCLPAGTVFGYFRHPQDQPTPPRRAFLKGAGLGWVDGMELQQWREVLPRRRKAGFTEKGLSRSCEDAPHFLRGYAQDFYWEYARWFRFFSTTGTRIHVSMFDSFPESETLHAALEDVGGVSVSIQRSTEAEPRHERRSVVDVHFAFSKSGAVTEYLSGASVHQFIVAGYPFSGSFPRARIYAQQIACRLRSLGVTFILCFLDEGFGVNPKTLGGGKQNRAYYQFLCDRLEEDATLGLVLKPKRPDTLPARLGPVWIRLRRLIDSGRCVLLKGRFPDEYFLPCAAAGASDLAINLLTGSTAGLESFLAGTPTLLLGGGTIRGPLQQLLNSAGIVFHSWEELWKEVATFRAHPTDSRVGNWEPILETLVSFRDVEASKRIRQYIVWLTEAFSMGRSREEALEYAGGRYSQTWGADLITEITQPSPALEELAREQKELVCL